MGACSEHATGGGESAGVGGRLSPEAEEELGRGGGGGGGIWHTSYPIQRKWTAKKPSKEKAGRLRELKATL